MDNEQGATLLPCALPVLDELVKKGFTDAERKLSMLTLLLRIALWYIIFGCIAAFAYIRKGYILDKEDGHCRGVLEFLQFDELPFFSWLFRMFLSSIAFLAMWPSLLRNDQPPLTIEVEDAD